MWKNKNTEIIYNRIMEVDAGRAGSKLPTTGSLISHYSASIFTNPNTQNPDHDDLNYEGDYEENNPSFIKGEIDIDWMEILISCHHMHGYRLDGKPLGIHNMPLDYY